MIQRSPCANIRNEREMSGYEENDLSSTVAYIFPALTAQTRSKS